MRGCGRGAGGVRPRVRMWPVASAVAAALAVTMTLIIATYWPVLRGSRTGDVAAMERSRTPAVVDDVTGDGVVDIRDAWFCAAAEVGGVDGGAVGSGVADRGGCEADCQPGGADRARGNAGTEGSPTMMLCELGGEAAARREDLAAAAAGAEVVP